MNMIVKFAWNNVANNCVFFKNVVTFFGKKLHILVKRVWINGFKLKPIAQFVKNNKIPIFLMVNKIIFLFR